MLMAVFVILHSDKSHQMIRSENILEPDEWVFLQRSFPYGKIDETAQNKAIHKVLEERLLQKKKKFRNEWEFVGPVNLGGRITDIEVPAGSDKTIYIAAASGGIFKSFYQGNSWFPIFEGQPSIAVGDMAISLSDTNVIYAGTGEPNAGGGSLAYDGDGIYRSADGGQTWQRKRSPSS